MLNSIRTRLTIAFLGLAVGPLLIVGLLLTLKSYDVQNQGAIALQREMAAHLSSRVQSFILNLESELHMLIRIEDLQKLGPERQKLILSIFHSQHSAIDDLILLDASGRVLSYRSRLKLAQDLPIQSQEELESFTVPMSRGVTYFGPVRFKELSGEPLMTMAVPIIALDTEKPEGVLVADVRLKEIWDLVAKIRPGQKGNSFIVDAENRVVAHSNPSVVLRGTHFDPPGFDGVQMGLGGQESVLVSQVISFGAQQFHIIVEEPVSEALALAIHTVRTMLTIVVIALLVAGGSGFLTVRRIVRPIEEIAETARAINAGDLSRRAVVKSRDELGVLASAFNKMTLQLETLINDLEKQVAERTAELTIAKDAAEEARRLAEAASQAKSVFLAQMSHELRTPLNAILGYAQILQRRPLAPDIVNAMNTVQHSGEHLLTLINDILDIAKIEAGRMELYPSEINFRNFLEHIASITRARAQAKDLTFRLERLNVLPVGVQADETRLRQVLLNLLDNAVKFTDQGEMVLSVGVCEDESGAPPHPHTPTLRFSVRDTGIGIPSDQLEHIFQPFEQVGYATRWTSGTGLGLTISRQLVRLMGGDLQVESQVDRGSTFWFEIVLPVTGMTMEAIRPPERTISGYRGPRRTVLVVDDVPSSRAILVDLLQPLGFEVIEAADGQQALHLAQELRPDLILMDRWMPGLDGFEAARRMRQIPELRKASIVTVSASVSQEDQAQSREVGIDAFLPKPVSWPRLAALLQECLALEWEYEERRSGGAEEQERRLSPAPLVPPPAEEMETLLDLARRGDMRAIREQAAHVEALGEQYVPFARRLHELAKNFEERQIRTLLEQYMEEG